MSKLIHKQRRYELSFYKYSIYHKEKLSLILPSLKKNKTLIQCPKPISLPFRELVSVDEVLGRIINGFTNCVFVAFVDDLDITGLGLATGFCSTRGGGGGCCFRGCFTEGSTSTSLKKQGFYL